MRAPTSEEMTAFNDEWDALYRFGAQVTKCGARMESAADERWSGKRAAIGGAPAESNPHVEGSCRWFMWHRGWLTGKGV